MKARIFAFVIMSTIIGFAIGFGLVSDWLNILLGVIIGILFCVAIYRTEGREYKKASTISVALGYLPALALGYWLFTTLK